VCGQQSQAYSLVGRSRDPDRTGNDQRLFLYEHYLGILQDLQPDFFVLENVPGVLTAHAEGEEIFQRMIRDFRSIKPAYEVAPSYDELTKDPRAYLIDSVHFGVPQRRKRVILVGYRRELAERHSSIRGVFKQIKSLERDSVLSVDDAIGDLPPLRAGEGDNRWFGPYTKNSSLKDYQLKMRETSPGICNHRARTHMGGDLERYKFFIEHHKNGDRRTTLVDLVQ